MLAVHKALHADHRRKSSAVHKALVQDVVGAGKMAIRPVHLAGFPGSKCAEDGVCFVGCQHTAQGVLEVGHVEGCEEPKSPHGKRHRRRHGVVAGEEACHMEKRPIPPKGDAQVHRCAVCRGRSVRLQLRELELLDLLLHYHIQAALLKPLRHLPQLLSRFLTVLLLHEQHCARTPLLPHEVCAPPELLRGDLRRMGNQVGALPGGRGQLVGWERRPALVHHALHHALAQPVKATHVAMARRGQAGRELRTQVPPAGEDTVASQEVTRAERH
mmetsp:Transcript_364/g.1125  ORF Transcript_364/g.1125 Transcript_364/m.1125 type:complete len:272 (+) Transcript_364:495-1310(+)